MAFNLIDIETWERKDCYNHFMTIAKCSYCLTVNVDVTIFVKYITDNMYRLYPAFTWIVARAINNHVEFKMSVDRSGNLGFFDEISPDYSVLNNKTKIVDSLCTPYAAKFSQFYKNMTTDLDKYENSTIKTHPQTNFFLVSCLPWLSYSSFSITNHSDRQFLFPIVTWGKYFEQNDRIFMPLTLQIHHAVADGYHCSLFYKDVEQVLQNPEDYLK